MSTTLNGFIESITFHNKNNNYTIAKLKTNVTERPVTILGYMKNIVPGQIFETTGNWTTHPKYGEQFKATSFKIITPSNKTNIKKYLESGIIKGIGPATAGKLINHFGDKTLDTIKNSPELLKEVNGIAETKIKLITESFNRHEKALELMDFLQNIGVDASLVSKIIDFYGDDSLDIIKNNPSRLAKDLDNQGFLIASAIARFNGKEINSEQHIKSCIIQLINKAEENGDVYLLQKKILNHCKKQLDANPDKTEEAILSLSKSGEIVVEISEKKGENRIFSKKLYSAEKKIASKIRALLSYPADFSLEANQQTIDKTQEKLAIVLSPEQIKTILGVFSSRVVLITGGPGTGKTTLIHFINAALEASQKQVALCAPTGRAARRLEQITNRKAVTIHKLLGFNLDNESFEKNFHNPVDADAIIIDESSMIDTWLMHNFLEAINLASVIILVGDAFQLPAIGAGNILCDLINSDIVPTYHLQTIFRQAQKSPIITNAHLIRNGSFPDFQSVLTDKKLSEFYFFEENDPDKILKKIIDLCSSKIPEKFGLDPFNDIQVLTPMHKGVTGTINLNHALQKALNPSKKIIETPLGKYKTGDKVIHLKNNYQKNVFNGDIGTITDINIKKNTLYVNYYGKSVNYSIEETNDLALAYAITVHKSQGSEYPAIIVPIVTSHFMLLFRNLIYTAITRGKQLVIVIGMKKAIKIALKNNSLKKRLTTLDIKLLEP